MKGLTRRILFAAFLREQAICRRVKTFTRIWRSGLALKDSHVCTPARIITSNNEFALNLTWLGHIARLIRLLFGKLPTSSQIARSLSEAHLDLYGTSLFRR
jgi:hypothetical protein